MTVATVQVANKLTFSRGEVMELMGVEERTYHAMVRAGVLRTTLLPGFRHKRVVLRESLVEAMERLNKPAE